MICAYQHGYNRGGNHRGGNLPIATASAGRFKSSSAACVNQEIDTPVSDTPVKYTPIPNLAVITHYTNPTH